MNLTNILLLLLLVTLSTYTFMPWKGIDKGSLPKILLQWLIWLITFSIVLFLMVSMGVVTSG